MPTPQIQRNWGRAHEVYGEGTPGIYIPNQGRVVQTGEDPARPGQPKPGYYVGADGGFHQITRTGQIQQTRPATPPTIGGPGGPTIEGPGVTPAPVAQPVATDPTPPAPTGGGASDGTTAAIEKLAEMIASMTDEMNKRDAARDALEQARADTQFSQNAASQQLQALETLGTPRTNMFSQFARNEPGAGIPIPGEAGAWIQQNQTPGFGTVSGNITTVPNDPYSAQRAFQAAIRGATSRGINDLSEAGRETLFGLGTVGGLDPTAIFREREAAIPRASRLFGSRVI